jgi:hypothetical protein
MRVMPSAEHAVSHGASSSMTPKPRLCNGTSGRSFSGSFCRSLPRRPPVPAGDDLAHRDVAQLHGALRGRRHRVQCCASSLVIQPDARLPEQRVCAASRCTGSGRHGSVVWLVLAADRLGRQEPGRTAPQAPPAPRGPPLSPPARPAAGPAPRAWPRRCGVGPAGHPRQFGR